MYRVHIERQKICGEEEALRKYNKNIAEINNCKQHRPTV